MNDTMCIAKYRYYTDQAHMQGAHHAARSIAAEATRLMHDQADAARNYPGDLCFCADCLGRAATRNGR